MLSEHDKIRHQMHKNASTGLWPLVFETLKKDASYINDMSIENDAALGHYAAQQGNLNVLSKLKDLGFDFNQITPSGLSVFDFATRHDELLTMIKTVAWLKGNTAMNFKDPTVYIHKFKQHQSVATF